LGQSLSWILRAGVERTTCIMRFIVLTVIKLKNILLDDKFKQSCEYISTESAFEGLWPCLVGRRKNFLLPLTTN
jgi:hypothetical protein